MQRDLEFVRGLNEAWRNAYGIDQTDEQIVERFDEVLNLLVRLRGFHRGHDAGLRHDRPRKVVAYVTAGGRLLTMIELDDATFRLQVPHGFAQEGETVTQAAARIAGETDVGRCQIADKLGADEQGIGSEKHDRHFFLLKTNSAARKRAWAGEHDGRRVEYS
jgi:hypothetical protein